MLEDLRILNGTMTPEFDIYNNIYSVDVDEKVTSLVIEYDIEDDYTVNIIDNNNFTSGENTVYIQIIKDKVIETYTLLVFKENAKEVINYDLYIEPLEVEKKLPEYVLPTIIGSCIFIIIIFFIIIFKKKAE